MTTKHRLKGQVAICSVLVLSLASSVVLPDGRVVSVAQMGVLAEGAHELPESVSPSDELSWLMEEVVALQMRQVIAPNGETYLVLGAKLGAVSGAGGFACEVILHGYGSTPPCVAVLEWEKE